MSHLFMMNSIIIKLIIIVFVILIMIDFKVKDLKAKDFILKGSMLLTYHLTFILYPNRIQQVQVEPKLGSNCLFVINIIHHLIVINSNHLISY